MTDDLIIQQIERATEAAEKLARWLEAAQRYRETQEQQAALQARVAQARRTVDGLEKGIQTPHATTEPDILVDEALAEFVGTVVAQNIAALFNGIFDAQSGADSCLDELFSDQPQAQDDVPELDAQSAREIVDDNIPEPAKLTEVFRLPDAPAKKPQPTDTAAIDSLLNNADPVWAQNLDNLSAAPDDTDAAELELLFNDLEDAPDSPWADPWDTMFEGNDPGAGSSADDFVLPPPQWDTGANTPSGVTAPDRPKKKRGVLQQWFFRN